jgi:hypothetical protein
METNENEKPNLGLMALVISQCGVIAYASAPEPVPLFIKCLMGFFFALAALIGAAWICEGS